MKDTEFIELLNLYLDHEISAADAARLESEVQTNLARRRIYQQYCRIQKACKMVSTDFHTDVEAASDPKIVPFNPAAAAAVASQRMRTNGLYLVGTFAAVAACVAVIFVNRSGQAGNAGGANMAAESSSSIVAPSAPIVNPEATFVASDSAALRGLVRMPQRPPVWLMRDPLLLTGNSQAEAVMQAAAQQVDHQLAWLKSVQLAPLPQREPADLHFAATLRTEGRPLGGGPSEPVKQNQESAESAALRWVK